MKKDCMTCRYLKSNSKDKPCHECIMKRIYGGEMYSNWKRKLISTIICEWLGVL